MPGTPPKYNLKEAFEIHNQGGGAGRISLEEFARLVPKSDWGMTYLEMAEKYGWEGSNKLKKAEAEGKIKSLKNGGSMAPIIPTYYKSKGTPIYRDTTSLPFRGGGPAELGCPPGMIFQNGNCIPNPTSLINTSGPRATASEPDPTAMSGMMKARLAYANEFGNSAAKRMVAPTDKPYNFEDGNVGTHYMGSYDNYAIPNIQDVPPLEFTGPRMDEAIKFDSPEDADYFAKNYKEVSPAFNEPPEKPTVEPKVEEDLNPAYEYFKNSTQPVDKFGRPNLNYTGPTSLARQRGISELIDKSIARKKEEDAKTLEANTAIVTDHDDKYDYKRVFNKDGTASYYKKDKKDSDWEEVTENSLNFKPIKAKVFNTDTDQWYGTEQQQDWDQKQYEKKLQSEGSWFGPIDKTERKKLIQSWYDPENKGADFMGSGEAPNVILTWAQDRDFLSKYYKHFIQNYGEENENTNLYRQLLSGKYGYNPSTRTIYKLSKMGDAGKSRVLDTSQDSSVQDVFGYFDDPEYYEKKEEAVNAPFRNFMKGRKKVHIDKEDGWNPHIKVYTPVFDSDLGEDRYGLTLKNEQNVLRRGEVDLHDFAGQDVYLTDEEYKQYHDAKMLHNNQYLWESGIMYLPGLIATAGWGAAGLMAATGETTLLGALGQTAIPQIIRAGVTAHGISNILDSESDLRKSWSNFVDDPSSANIANAAGETLLTGAEIYSGAPLLQTFKNSKNMATIGKAFTSPIPGFTKSAISPTSLANYITPANITAIGFANYGINNFIDPNSDFRVSNQNYQNTWNDPNATNSEKLNASLGTFGENMLQGLNFFGAGEYIANQSIKGYNSLGQTIKNTPGVRSFGSGAKSVIKGETPLSHLFTGKSYTYTTNNANQLKQIRQNFDEATEALNYAKQNHTQYTAQEIQQLEKRVEDISTQGNYLLESTKTGTGIGNYSTDFGYNQYMTKYEASQAHIKSLQDQLFSGKIRPSDLTTAQLTSIRQSITNPGTELTNFSRNIDKSKYGYKGSQELLERQLNYLAGRQNDYFLQGMYKNNPSLQKIMGDAPVNPNEYINIYGRNPLIPNYKNQSFLNQQTSILKRNIEAEIKLAQQLERSLSRDVKPIKETTKQIKNLLKTSGPSSDK